MRRPGRRGHPGTGRAGRLRTDRCRSAPRGWPAARPRARTPTDPLRAGPLRAGPLRAGPLRAGPLRAGPLRAGPLRAGPLRTGPLRAGPVQAGPVQAGPVRAGSLRTGPLRACRLPADWPRPELGAIRRGPFSPAAPGSRRRRESRRGGRRRARRPRPARPACVRGGPACGSWPAWAGPGTASLPSVSPSVTSPRNPARFPSSPSGDRPAPGASVPHGQRLPRRGWGRRSTDYCSGTLGSETCCCQPFRKPRTSFSL